MKNKLIQEIKQKLNLSGGMFIDGEIESYIDEIPENKYITKTIKNHRITISTKANLGSFKPKNRIDHQALKSNWRRKIPKANFKSFFLSPFCQIRKSDIPIKI